MWNYNGDFHNDENRLDIVISVNETLDNKIYDKDKDDIRIYVNRKETYLALQNNFLTTSMYQHFQLSFKKTEVQRLPAPYTSKCVANSAANIFPGEYSLEHCMATKRCVNSFKKCGDTYDFCFYYIPEELKKAYFKKNKTIREMHECLQKVYYDNRRVTDCDLPCHDTLFEIYGSSFHFREEPKNMEFRLSMRFEEPYTFRLEKEEELYGWGDLLGGIGGNVGLFCGFSVLSLVEILSFVVLRVWVSFAKRHLVCEERKHEKKSSRDADEIESGKGGREYGRGGGGGGSNGGIPMEDFGRNNDRELFSEDDDNESDGERSGEEENMDEIKGRRLYYSQTLI